MECLYFFDLTHFQRQGQKSKNNLHSLFFGSNENRKICFQNFLTFMLSRSRFGQNQLECFFSDVKIVPCGQKENVEPRSKKAKKRSIGLCPFFVGFKSFSFQHTLDFSMFSYIYIFLYLLVPFLKTVKEGKKSRNKCQEVRNVDFRSSFHSYMHLTFSFLSIFTYLLFFTLHLFKKCFL